MGLLSDQNRRGEYLSKIQLSDRKTVFNITSLEIMRSKHGQQWVIGATILMDRPPKQGLITIPVGVSTRDSTMQKLQDYLQEHDVYKDACLKHKTTQHGNPFFYIDDAY